MANQESQFDTSIEIITPENIAFEYRLAGPFRRLMAHGIDFFVQCVAIFGASVALTVVFAGAGLGGMGTGVSLVLWFLLSWFYGGVFEAFWNGQTPGKRMMRIRVLSIDGQPINALQAVLRNVLKTVDMQPIVFCLVGLVTAAVNRRFQRLGDLACGTMVVVEERQWLHGVVPAHEAETLRLAGLIPRSFSASRGMARALAAYVQRRQTFPLARRLEIARHLGEPLRAQFGLPADTSLDLLLCGAYQRTFIGDREEPGREAAWAPSARPRVSLPTHGGLRALP